MDLANLTAVQAAAAVRAGRITARELTGAYLERCTALNSKINSFINIFAGPALRQADTVDQKIKHGANLPLAGVPVAVKDDFCCQDGPTTCGSAALQHFRPPGSAAAVQKLVDAGAVIVGKTNLDQFGLGSSTAGSFAGPTANPRDPKKVAGDGGAAAVAAGQCLLALSSDTGGSLRIGASHCGLSGLLPTSGLVSRYGLHTFASSFARAGVIARDSADAYAALQILAGCDPRDAATATVQDGISGPDNEVDPRKLKAGYPAAVFAMPDDPVRSSLEGTREVLASMGMQFVDISLPLFREALQAYYVIALAEASSNLSRFDGIRFGAAGEGRDLEEWYGKTRSAALGEEGKRRSVIGAALLSTENYGRYYRQAQKIWALVRDQFAAALAQCHLIVLPAAAAPAGTAASYAEKDFLETYREDLFCAPVSLSGLPVLCVPAGTAGGLPVGMQLVGRPFAEAVLAGLAGRLAETITGPAGEGR